jgi:hypothetical protein
MTIEALPPMDEADRFRAKAEECRRSALKMQLNHHRDVLLDTARRWDEGADRLDAQMGKKHGETPHSPKDDSSSSS